MSRFEVQTGDLSGAASTHSEIAARIRDSSANIRGVASGAGGAAGERGAAQAFDDLGERWGTSIGRFADAVASLTENMGAAAAAYAETDDGVFGVSR